MKCPDCKKDLNVTRQSNSFLFQCNFCGLKETIFVTDKTEAYTQLVDSKQSRRDLAKQLKKKKEENLFPVPRKTKEEKRKLIQNGGYDPQKIPSAIKNIINNPDIELIYYGFLEQKFPKHSSKKMEFPEKLSSFLSKNNLVSLYEFQQEAFDLIDKGEDIVIVAPTGTGKTEAFTLPVLTQIWNKASHPLQRRGLSALIIYPTKALAKDQEKKIKKYGNPLGITCEVYDGDTPKTKREKILESPPDILITNPDMLHYHMRNLPFVSIIRNLKFIIIDEIHVAIGAFGSNLYFILKRLQRLVSNKIQFIGSSATIGNALDFSSQLFDREVTAIIVEEARKAPTHLLITIPWNVSQYTITSEITRQLVTSGHKTLCFQNSHKNAEIINLLLRSARIRSAVHRAGLTRQYRNKVEQKFREGDLDALVSTPTLELGIDIGDVDGVVSSIVNITSFIQRLGRAGRKGQESIGSLILRNDDPISTFYSVYPETYFADIRQGYVEPKNEIVSYYQLLAAVLEKPIEQEEFTEHKTMLTQLEGEEKLLKTADGGYKAKSRTDILRLLRAYSIRGIGDTLLLKDKTGKRLGERSMPMAARELHPGAIYLHGGKHYRSSTFKYDNRFGGGEILLQPIPPINQKTTANRYAIPSILAVNERKKVLGTEVIYCDLKITEQVTGYNVNDIFTNKLLETKKFDDPIIYSFRTKGFMFTMPKPINLLNTFANIPEDLLLNGTFHAVEHVVIESSSMLTGGGSSEIGGISMGKSGAIFVYDGSKGGSGLSKLLYDKLEEGLNRSLKILENCTCKTSDGCPRCTYSYQCGNNNQPLSKTGAIESIKLLNQSKLKIIDNYAEYDAYV
ncbi:MAG: DEAD/DEAH box helicase [Candidatus Heimdallarchaeota archaeon]|nr:DEAD/DEAH box helicase [Candidatus Heimdallarchaeota archaeon]